MFLAQSEKIIWKEEDLSECITNIINDNLGYILETKEKGAEIIEITSNINIDAKDIKVECQNNQEILNIIQEQKKCFIILKYIKDNIKLRIYINNKQKILKIRVLKRKYKGLLVASRRDGFGSRMTAFITAIYLARKTNLKFGYSWDKLDGIVFMDDEQELFEKDFIQQHSYSSKLPKGDTNTLSFTSIDELKRSEFKKPWGNYVMNYYVLEKKQLADLDEEEYLKEFGKIFYELPLKNRYKQCIKSAKMKAKELGDFIAIHMRAGDSIYDESYRRLIFSPVIMKYVFPVEIAIHTIKYYVAQNKRVVLFSADIKANDEIGKLLKDLIINKTLILANNAYKNLNEMQAQIFEISLMAQASKIIANHSTYSKFANALGGGGKLINFTSLFDSKTIFNALNQYFNRLNVHNVQKAASCAFMLDWMEKKQIGNLEQKIFWCNRALEYDYNNSIFRIILIKTLLQSKKYARADMILQYILPEREEEFLSSLFGVLWGQYVVFSKEQQLIINIASQQYPYISYLAAKISQKENKIEEAIHFCLLSLTKEPNNELFLILKKELKIYETKPKKTIKTIQKPIGAVKRVKNHLSYKLGQIMIQNSKSYLSYIKMPYALAIATLTHKKTLYKKLPDLKNYADYKKALKEKECFTYKLGEALIKAHKNWYKGGYLKFYFKDVPRLRREFKNKKGEK